MNVMDEVNFMLNPKGVIIIVEITTIMRLIYIEELRCVIC